MKKTVAVVLAGGSGTRLYPLTDHRAKPAVPIGGKYRIIDFTLSTCLHSDIRRILVLTQYRSHSLLKHLRNGWSVLSPEMGEYITAIPAQMKGGEHWYQGTADAVFQNIDLLQWNNAKYVIVLSGDHVYRMDYAAMLRQHIARGAEATIACIPVPLNQGHSFGVVEINEAQSITGFAEKPEHPRCMHGRPDQCLASMGIYIFDKETLIRHLIEDQNIPDSSHDFGADVLPRWAGSGRVYAYLFGGSSGRVADDNYWHDVGTLDAYFEANMDLLKPVPPLNLYQEDWPIRTYSGQHPPCRTGPSGSGSQEDLSNVIMGSGSTVIGASVHHSILSNFVHVAPLASVEDSVIFSDVRVGEGACLKHCIIDKHVEIPAHERIGFDPVADRQRFTVSDGGVTVVPMGYCFN
ncbi:MAG: glucose-1-phosphate adenylyltransferase [Mariprofundaceae bacterium]